MEFPFGHNKHHYGRQDEEQQSYPPPQHQSHSTNYPRREAFEEEGYPPPPPHHYGGQDEEQQSYPPPQHQSHSTNYPRREAFEEEGYPPPPPRPLHPYENQMPGYTGGEEFRGEFPYPRPYQPPLQPPYSRQDQVEPGYQRPPPPSDFGFPPPTYSSAVHVAHEVNQDPSEPRPPDRHHGRNNPFTSFFHHHSHGTSELAQKRTVRVFCQAEERYSLTIRDGKVILAIADPSDEFQHWIKDEKYSIRVKDEEGFPSFALVNNATGQALKHSIGATHPVQLCPYNPDVLDESVLWTESRDTGEGFRAVRMVNNIRLNLDAFNGDKNHGGVHDGTVLVLWEWKKGGNQKWKIAPY
ncbi:ricin B-like lectin EULS3 [Aristolochia californica]|uniref:ricin B-like lectin EULS3 n=1 Tax=Aristolochia californica TaxID=171875 RepID=UPI0035D5A688